MTQDEIKRHVAQAAIAYLPEKKSVIGVGTGSTTNFFIDALSKVKDRIEGAVASSNASAARLSAYGIPVFDVNTVAEVPLYIDGADQSNQYLQLIKGGGAALTREKILAAIADQFICIADDSKLVPVLGTFPLPVEVIPMARSYVVRELVKLGGHPALREGVVTDNGNLILDVYGLHISEPTQLETAINQITGVVTNGIFALRRADVLLLGTAEGVRVLT